MISANCTFDLSGLYIPFERLGQRVVHDEANIGLIDAHPESDCGADNSHLVLHPPLLHLRVNAATYDNDES